MNEGKEKKLDIGEIVIQEKDYIAKRLIEALKAITGIKRELQDLLEILKKE